MKTKIVNITRGHAVLEFTELLKTDGNGKCIPGEEKDEYKADRKLDQVILYIDKDGQTSFRVHLKRKDLVNLMDQLELEEHEIEMELDV